MRTITSKFASAALFAAAAIIASYATSASAQELYQEYQETLRGKVVEIVKQERRQVPGTETTQLFQTIRAEIIEGPRKGESVTIENDYLELEKGDKFYFNHLKDIGGFESYAVINIDRRASLGFLAAVFAIAVIAFGGKQGLRSLLSLVGSFLAIFYVLLPGLLGGWNPVVASSLVASGILFIAIFFTHGFNRESLVAYAGTMVAVIATGLFAYVSVNMADLSGFSSDESVYLNFNTQGTLDFAALLLGAIVLGVLGVLDDIAVTQAAVVSELYAARPDLTRREAYARAVRVGREHVSALVNTLVLAYAGASLPLLLYVYVSPSSFGSVMNMEIIATEIVRAIVGSLGLILTVPIVTALGAYYLKGRASQDGRRPHAHHHH